jgi:hypothetical protein
MTYHLHLINTHAEAADDREVGICLVSLDECTGDGGRRIRVSAMAKDGGFRPAYFDR